MRPENIVWLFGSGRTGSSWVSQMVRGLPEWGFWGEPAIGKLFGDIYHWRGAEQRADNTHFIMPAKRSDLWRPAVRAFVMESVRARYPEESQGGPRYLFVKEPNGSAGAWPILDALPESCMIFLVRDPRDIVASFLAGARSWLQGNPKITELATTDPDSYVNHQSHTVRRSLLDAREAYESHRGLKALVRYEDLRADTLGEMKRLFSDLALPLDEAALASAVERYDFDNPHSPQKKGSDKRRRKATPGAWREDLTPEQVRTVERVCRPIFKAFYA